MNDNVEQVARRASELLRSGRLGEALIAHRQLVAARPDLADAWFNLAYLQRCARSFEEALESYGRAIDAGVRGPEEAHLNRAVILSEHLDRPEDAELELKRALALNPGNLLILLNLGNLYEDLGAADSAREAYGRALRIAPTNGRAAARLAVIDVFERRAAEAVPRLRALLAKALPAEDSAEIGFALGTALDALGDYDSAFEAFRKANAASRASAPPPGIEYDAAARERLVDTLIEAFPAPAPRQAPNPPEPGRAPIFVCGMFRSGSTLAEQILGRHSRVTAGGELEFLPALVQQSLRPYPQAAASASAQTLADLRRQYLEGLAAVHPDAEIVTDKRPDNFLHIGLIKKLFPDAKIVHTRRHPLDNLLSIYFLHFTHAVDYGLSLADSAHWYRQYSRLMDHWKSLYPSDIFDFDYDSAVFDPRREVAAMLEFCGLEWEEACLASSATSAAVRTASAWQVRQPLHSRSSGRWRSYERYLGDAKRELGLP